MSLSRRASSRSKMRGLTSCGESVRKIGIVIFDLDGTLTHVKDIWLYLHEKLKVGSPIENLEKEYLAGKISYEEWAEADASRWKGLRVKMVEAAINRVQFARGAREAVQTLRDSGIEVGVVSAGIDLLAKRAERELGLDFAVANELCSNNGFLTGKVLVRVETLRKVKAMEQKLQESGHTLEKSATVGDNWQDLHPKAGLKVAFGEWDEKIAEIADVTIQGYDFNSLLRILLPDCASAA